MFLVEPSLIHFMQLISFTAQKYKVFHYRFLQLSDQIRREVPPEKFFLWDVSKETSSIEWINKVLDFTIINNISHVFLKLFKI